MKSLLEPFPASPAVIVDHGAENIEPRAFSRHNDILAAVFEACQSTGRRIKLSLETTSFDNKETGIRVSEVLRNPVIEILRQILRFAQDDRGGVVWRKVHLVLADLVTLLGPEHVFFKEVADIQVTFLPFRQGANPQGLCDFSARSEIGDLKRAIPDLLSVRHKRPTGIVGARLVIVAVEQVDLDYTPGDIRKRGVKVLIHFLDLPILGLRRTVTIDNSIHHKLTIIGNVPEVASGSEIFDTIRSIVPKRLVHPVPDGAAHEEVGGIN